MARSDVNVPFYSTFFGSTPEDPPFMYGDRMAVSTLKSLNYVAGSAGWMISNEGAAEFNDITIRGTLQAASITGDLTMTGSGRIRTAASGTRIEMSSAGGNRLDFFTGDNDEAIRPSVSSAADDPNGLQYLHLSSGQRTGGVESYIRVQSTPGFSFDSEVVIQAERVLIDSNNETLLMRMQSMFTTETVLQINSGSKTGLFSVTAQGSVHAAGGGAQYGFQEIDGSGEWVLYANGASARLWNGGDLFIVDAGSTTVMIATGYELTMNQTSIWLRNFNDNNHRIFFDPPQNGPSVYGFGNVSLYSVQADAIARLQNDGNFVLFDNGSFWDMKSITSSIDVKDDIADLEDGAMALVKKFRPVSFKRRYKDNRADRRRQFEDASTAYQAAVVEAAEGRVNPDFVTPVHETWTALQAAEATFGEGGRLHPDNIRTEVGFVAEELELVEPRLIRPATGEMPVGIMYQQMTALLTKALQEVDARLAGVEAVPVVATALKGKK